LTHILHAHTESLSSPKSWGGPIHCWSPNPKVGGGTCLPRSPWLLRLWLLLWLTVSEDGRCAQQVCEREFILASISSHSVTVFILWNQLCIRLIPYVTWYALYTVTSSAFVVDITELLFVPSNHC